MKKLKQKTKNKGENKKLKKNKEISNHQKDFFKK